MVPALNTNRNGNSFSRRAVPAVFVSRLNPKKTAGRARRLNEEKDFGLSLGELEASAGAALAVFFAFLHSAVAGEEAGAAEAGLEAAVVFG
jgi:hypothetical protein